MQWLVPLNKFWLIKENSIWSVFSILKTKTLILTAIVDGGVPANILWFWSNLICWNYKNVDIPSKKQINAFFDISLIFQNSEASKKFPSFFWREMRRFICLKGVLQKCWNTAEKTFFEKFTFCHILTKVCHIRCDFESNSQ